jgi:hypothetical protein
VNSSDPPVNSPQGGGDNEGELDMKASIKEAFVEDIDAVGSSWVLRDPAGMYFLVLSLHGLNFVKDDSWGRIIKTAVMPQINALRSLHQQAVDHYHADPFRIYHPWKGCYVSFMDFSFTDTLADSVRTKYASFFFMFARQCHYNRKRL